MTLYMNKYRVETTRLKNWDYTRDSWYFITVCTMGRENLFGTIENGIINLNENGRIVEQCWFDLPNHYSNLILDAFVVMPNHIHGIMIIDNTQSHSKTHGIFEFVRALKTFSSRRMNYLNNTAGKQRWQTRFHDHIIHDEQELKRIQQYIHNNPSSWVNDSLNAK